MITGGSGGLGAGIAVALAREGADCLLAYNRDKEGAQKTAAAIDKMGRRAHIVQGDVGSEDDVEAMYRAVEKEFGRLDIIVANAGISAAKHLLETTAAEFQQIIQTNLMGTYLTVRHGAQMMTAQKQGKIITMSSVHGLGGTHWCSLYEATKAGIINFTRGAAFDLSDYNIQVNCLAPGAVPHEKDPAPKEGGVLHEAWMQYTPLGRFGSVEDVGAAAVYLASSDSDWVTGQVMVIDGGVSAGPLIPSFKYYGDKPRMSGLDEAK